VFSSIQQADGRKRLAALRDKIFEFMCAQINAGNCIIRGNGSGVKVEHILSPFAERYGVRLSKREMLQHLADLELDERLAISGKPLTPKTISTPPGRGGLFAPYQPFFA
jgi:hypothetical protein